MVQSVIALAQRKYPETFHQRGRCDFKSRSRGLSLLLCVVRYFQHPAEGRGFLTGTVRCPHTTMLAEVWVKYYWGKHQSNKETKRLHAPIFKKPSEIRSYKDSYLYLCVIYYTTYVVIIAINNSDDEFVIPWTTIYRRIKLDPHLQSRYLHKALITLSLSLRTRNDQPG